MVTLDEVRASNRLIATEFPSRLVAVFVGATSGIGEYTLKAFVKSTVQPVVYFIGRSQDSGDRITSQCQTLNANGEYTFIASDVSLLRNVDDICRQIAAKEEAINLLVVSQGTLVFNTETEEGLHYAAALVQYSRMRFISNLLPLLQNATSAPPSSSRPLRRVLTIFAGTKEGTLTDPTDTQCRRVPMTKFRGHAASLITLGLEILASQAPTVSFIHAYPGLVNTGIARGTTGVFGFVLRSSFALAGRFFAVDDQECGERHLYLCTSRRYAAIETTTTTTTRDTKPEKEEGMAIGTNGQVGSGVYSVDAEGESAGPEIVGLLAGLRREGAPDKFWHAMKEDFKRITGSEVCVL